MASTVLRTSTAVLAGHSLLAGRTTERLTTAAVGVRRVGLHETVADGREALEGVETLVLLDVASGDDLDGTGGSEVDLAGVRHLLAAADAAGVRSVVVLSSAMVYGAGPDNPVPLTEDAAIRPEPALPYALARAELERLVADYRDGGPDRTVVVLRTAVILHAGSTEWLRRSPWGRRGLPPDDIIAPRQFVHLDDVVDAVELACVRSLDGTYNVAPDGWIAGETFADLVGGALAPLPARARRVLWALRRAAFGPALSPGLEPYTERSWVIASDRLRTEGWQPMHTSEETLVEADPARGWRALSPRARQELSLGAMGALAVGAVAGGVVFLRRRRRDRA
jgi:nucleoside-diphosphate-sugar epimerase